MKRRAVAVRDAIRKGENTAARVGGVIADTIDTVEQLSSTVGTAAANAADAKSKADNALATANATVTTANNAKAAAATAREESATANNNANDAKSKAASAKDTAEAVKQPYNFTIGYEANRAVISLISKAANGLSAHLDVVIPYSTLSNNQPGLCGIALLSVIRQWVGNCTDMLEILRQIVVGFPKFNGFISTTVTVSPTALTGVIGITADSVKWYSHGNCFLVQYNGSYYGQWPGSDIYQAVPAGAEGNVLSVPKDAVVFENKATGYHHYYNAATERLVMLTSSNVSDLI